ncbi:alpha,alpha-trehalose-phosphate synthase [UDP-forming], putative [Phytophthora infestans T30-4]|uniref:Alpha,alpha-trehalose-phosphate synthase [UDP-forming], putative n=1 Tax=Phytophthora infestans (strain T30-4) TaxID=403677 RepID=D0P4S2_PHYIT|nr:alpha,alpha-trehalose-phosphate synthase [UDP-forming], putative [Phytophthora infestans T30-4]EEY68908.1 alpha,alpha-trehalose-phosphate synthase [UDP-forming], putative [Phytophthora infestans T30-4]|eukprot:XP_002996882.1 alpha,alpha-trehalose-phosphate synthase [UDP-forming], putative [Phytophthora infestans T30-4]
MIESQNTLSHYEISERATIKFVGRVVDADVPFEERQQVELLLREFNCFPVFLEPQEAKLYYEDYCKQTLWPTFHNVVDVYSPVDVVLDVQAQQHLAPSAQFWNPNWQKVAWQAYANVNQLFAHKICELYEQGDVVWVQDYHLLLTPSYIVRKLRAANVGLFLHVPFPSSEVFRTVSMRKELLRGMLNADHIGFHLFEYARHFMSACRRILRLSYEPILRGQLGIDYGGRRVAVTCSHMAIDVQRIEETLVSKDVRDMVVALRQKYRDKKIFAGCDSIERLKGIPSKMLAFDGFLSRCPDFIGKAVLVQKGIHRRGRVTDYLQSKKEIELAVKAINSKYRDVAKGNVVDYEEVEEFPFKERVALWRVADVQITTVLRDGLNTTPFEYIATHKTSPGVLILSEFSGSSRLLSGALTVNPWELDQVIDALRDAVYMPTNEREHRRNCDFQFVAANPPRRWAKCVLTDIVNARKKEESFVYMGTGFGLDFRLMEVSAQFRKLTGQELTPAYRTSTNRAIFLDYYRTLAPDVSTLMGVRWPDVPLSALSTLEHLCKDPRNTVFIVSGCNCDLLTQKFGGVPGLGLVAEHGYFIRRAVLGNNARIGRPWERHGDILQSDGGHQQWRVKAEKIVQLYVDRTNGSTLELRRSAVLFRYGKSDFDFGALQAAELKEHLEGVFEGWPLNIIQGKDYIEVRPEGVGKGKLIGHLLNKMRVDGNPTDFVLCIGDDVADELMFEQLKTMTAHEELPQDKVFTCTVGQKPSKAEFFVDDYTDVIALLKSLKVVATKSNRNYSLSDMQSFVRDTRPFLSSSSHGTSGVSRSATSDAVIRKSSSRHALYNHLTPVIEDQINTWLNRLQQLGVVAVLVGILRWRSGVKNPREKKLLMYLVASLGIAWSIQRLRSRPHK